jgi:hypothetical protein
MVAKKALDHTSESILLCLFWRCYLVNYLPGLTLNQDPHVSLPTI